MAHREGQFGDLNNGIEFAMTYFIMLLVLFFQGAGRFLSVDYWIERRLAPGAHVYNLSELRNPGRVSLFPG